MSSRASRTKQCPACGTAVWLEPGEIWAKCTSCGRQIHRGEVKDDDRIGPASRVQPPSTVAPSTVTTAQTRRTIYLLVLVPLVLAILAGVASFLSHEERATPRVRPAPSALSDAGAPG
ncbi:MAG: hypothetical protein ABI175_22725 [Polyangiales bacterium]